MERPHSPYRPYFRPQPCIVSLWSLEGGKVRVIVSKVSDWSVSYVEQQPAGDIILNWTESVKVKSDLRRSVIFISKLTIAINGYVLQSFFFVSIVECKKFATVELLYLLAPHCMDRWK